MGWLSYVTYYHIIDFHFIFLSAKYVGRKVFLSQRSSDKCWLGFWLLFTRRHDLVSLSPDIESKKKEFPYFCWLLVTLALVASPLSCDKIESWGLERRWRWSHDKEVALNEIFESLPECECAITYTDAVSPKDRAVHLEDKYSCSLLLGHEKHSALSDSK